LIAIKNASTGEVHFVEHFNAAGYPGWAQFGPAVPNPVPEFPIVVGGAWVSDPAKTEAMLIAQVKAEAERRKMLVRSPGSGKGAEYRRKRDEAMASATVTAALLNALTRPAALQQYPGAAMEAALTGEPLATVLNRYRTVSAAADSEVLRLSALEQNASRLIKAASAAADKHAVVAAINWNWSPQ